MDTHHPQRERACAQGIYHYNLLECCKDREDLWVSEIENCFQGCIDLVAPEARYMHNSCLTKFMLKRDLKKKITATGKSLIIWLLIVHHAASETC